MNVSPASAVGFPAQIHGTSLVMPVSRGSSGACGFFSGKNLLCNNGFTPFCGLI